MMGLVVRLLPYLLSFLSSLCIMILELVASRLVATHVGASLSVWTSVIGIMLGGICLGNVLGGRLADRVEPSRAVGPLYALGAFLTLSCLWMNAVVGLTPGLESMPWNLRTVVVVTLDFLIPATVLGMIGPVVAKMAVEQSRKAGSAIGDVYFFGAVGSIVGTFLAGFILMYLAPISTIVTIVAAVLALLAAALIGTPVGTIVGLLTAALLGLGSIAPLVRMIPVQGVTLGSIPINPLALGGHVLSIALAIIGVRRLLEARRLSAVEAATDVVGPVGHSDKTTLTDLAILSFVASLAFMSLEMVAGRLVTRHLGSSIYGWTSIIGVLLGGLSLGNLLGGKIADYIQREKQASWLFMVASMLTLSILLLETPPQWFARIWMDGESKAILSLPISVSKLPLPRGELYLQWPARVLLAVFAVFFLPSVAMGTVSPVVAKLAVERLRGSKRTGTAIGQVYAWGMVGSILGTFLTGFVLIDTLGSKGVLLILAAALAFAATSLGSVWHAAWAGIPLGLCVIAFIPAPWFQKQGLQWGIREESGNPATTEDAIAWVDESDYYYIKVTNEPVAEGQKRTLVLDNLIHGYFILDHPERLDYDYEHIYALVAHRLAQAKKLEDEAAKSKSAPLNNLFLGGGAYTFQRYMQHTYPGAEVDVAEIDPAVTYANHKALGLPEKTTINTSWGDARQFVERNQNSKQYDLIFGDAFNDFSVPWHLTTKQFNDKIAKMMSPNGIYMINIIDAYKSDETAKEVARTKIADEDITDAKAKSQVEREEREQALKYGGFLGAWVKTAKLTFPHVYIFGTDNTPGSGLRETFVVVASKQPLENLIKDLGSKDDDPKFFQNDELFEPKPFGEDDQKQVEVRSRGIVLTDDYAPVENLLAPVAATRGDD
ncbi:fused MFS/spermidine synthase [Singulisphaera sp. Ch08]|uniref:Fused MFS/spermidine synthase n=1 Tax=Singulisphaera sp. Ch08 TaxID=3120278 RepID=A0AAU7CSU8_9BACT